MKTRSFINLPRAVEIASNWHGGQWSTLYQFASSHNYLLENHLLYLEEIIQEIHRPETALKPFHRSKKQTNELISLKRFIEMQGEKNNVLTEWVDDRYKVVPFPKLKEENQYVLEHLKKFIKPIVRMG